MLRALSFLLRLNQKGRQKHITSESKKDRGGSAQLQGFQKGLLILVTYTYGSNARDVPGLIETARLKEAAS
jgi:hypothetical protein